MTLVLCKLRYFSKLQPLKTVLFYSQPGRASRNDIAKVVNVAILGSPNSGKSTLINKIVDRKICAASNKVHTTTKMVRAMCIQNDTQIIILDTPGVVTEKEQRKYNLPASMMGACEKSLRCADVIGVVHDVSDQWTKDNLHLTVLLMLKLVPDIPCFLIMNKVDKLKSKTQLLSLIRNLTNGCISGKPIPGSEKKTKGERGYSKFSDVFLVSALNGDGVIDIKNYLTRNAKPASLHYSPEEWTDQAPEDLVIEAVRAKFLDFLSQEIPYNLKTNLEYFEQIDEENKIVCSVNVECPSDRIARLISGAGGGRLNQIKTHTRNDLMELFKKSVVLDIRLSIKNKPSEDFILN